MTRWSGLPHRSTPMWMHALPPAGWLLVLCAAGSSAAIYTHTSARTSSSVELWTFARTHKNVHDELVRQDAPGSLAIRLFAYEALQQRIHSGLRANTVLPDLFEMPMPSAGHALSGPPSSIGLLDLRERLEREGWMNRIHQASLDAYTRGSGVYALPHDAHPVLLAYRHDIFQKHRVDINKIHTWDDFAALRKRLMGAPTDQGNYPRYLMKLDLRGSAEEVHSLIQQAGGGAFDSDGTLRVDREINAEVLTKLTCWTASNERFITSIGSDSGPAARLFERGVVLAALMPDWMTGVWKLNMPQLRGKFRLMPLPAWRRGGLRTSTWGSTAMAISKKTQRPDAAWETSKRLYLSKTGARRTYALSGIISPVRDYWREAFYHQPDAYFSGQAIGTAFIDVMNQVPRRVLSPLRSLAVQELLNTLMKLRAMQPTEERCMTSVLRNKATRLLAAAQARLAEIERRQAWRTERQP